MRIWSKDSYLIFCGSDTENARAHPFPRSLVSDAREQNGYIKRCSHKILEVGDHFAMTHIAFVNAPSNEYFYGREGRCQVALEKSPGQMFEFYPPTYLAQYASVLEHQGHKCKILDCGAQKITKEETIAILKKFNTDILVINVTTLSFDDDITYVKYVKSNLDLPIAAIGPHGSVVPESLLRNGIDVVVRGEGEFALLDIVEKIGTSKQLSLAQDVRGISYLKHGRLMNKPDAELIMDLDSFPFPARHLLCQAIYKDLAIHGHHYTIIRGSRGCPFNCRFCIVSKISGRKMRFRSPQNIIEELKIIKEKNSVSVVSFFDSLFTANRKHAIELCKRILRSKLNIHWFANTRADTVDLEMMSAMKKAGCVGVTLGIESGSQEMLDNMRKQAKVKDYERGMAICKNAGLLTFAYFVLGFPGETYETIQETKAFIKRTKPDSIAIAFPIPFPGTDLYEYARREGLLQFDSWNDFARKLKEGFCVTTRFLTFQQLLREKREILRGFFSLKSDLRIDRLVRMKQIGLKNLLFCRPALSRRISTVMHLQKR